jgi:small subunit ribosomal protein S6
VKEFVERFKRIIEGQQGTVSNVDEWGLRDLAYRIQKQGKGFYILLQYGSSGRAVEELERNLKLTDGILRYLTVRVDLRDEGAPSESARSPSVEHAAPSREAPAKSETEA